MRRLGLIAVVIALLALGGSAYAQAVQNVEVHGYMQNRLYMNPSSSMRFAVERVSVSGVATLANKANAYVELYFYPNVATSGTTVESSYVDFPFAQGRIRVGKGRPLNFGITPSYPNRKTSQYGILSEVFTLARIQGLQYTRKSGIWDGGVSFYSDTPALAELGVGQFPGSIDGVDSIKHFTDRESSNITGRMAGSMRVGFSTPCFGTHLSYAQGALTQANANAVALPYFGAGYVATTGHDKYGLDTTYARGPYVVQGEFYRGRFGVLRLNGYSLLAGYQPKDALRAYVRWSSIASNMSPLADPTTWEPRQLTLAIVQPIQKGVWLECDFEKNMERGGNVKNDLFFVELFTGF